MELEDAILSQILVPNFVFFIQEIQLVEKPWAAYPNWVKEYGPHDARHYDDNPPGNSHTPGKVDWSFKPVTFEDLVSDHWTPAGIAIERREDNLEEKQKKAETKILFERSAGTGAVRVRPAGFPGGRSISQIKAYRFLGTGFLGVVNMSSAALGHDDGVVNNHGKLEEQRGKEGAIEPGRGIQGQIVASQRGYVQVDKHSNNKNKPRGLWEYTVFEVCEDQYTVCEDQ